MVVIRCDSSFEIGTGHVYRDLSLAGQLEALGLVVEFVCRDFEGHIISKITTGGFKAHKLPASITVEDELSYIHKLQPNWVVIDHYKIDFEYQTELKKWTSVFVIDDMMNRRHNCHVLLDQNFRTDYVNAYKNLVPQDCLRLLGPKHSLLPAALDRQGWQRDFNHQIKEVLVFFGGADPTGEILKFEKALMEAALCKKIFVRFRLVATASHQFYKIIQNKTDSDWITWHKAPDNWHDLIRSSDFYFGSTGTVTWERFYFGLPGAVICTADNQIQIAEELEKEGYLKYYGFWDKIDYSIIIPDLQKRATDDIKNKESSLKLQQLVERISVETLKKIFL